MQKIVLKNFLLVDGKKIKELKFDTENFTGEMFERANNSFRDIISKGKTSVIELDPSYHLAVGKLIIEASNEGVSFEDLSRLKGADLFKVAQEGRNFLLGADVETSEITQEQLDFTADVSTMSQDD